MMMTRWMPEMMRFISVTWILCGWYVANGQGFHINVVPRNGFIFNNREINTTNLHQFLEEHESHLLFGGINDAVLENRNDKSGFQIVEVKHRKRSARAIGNVLNLKQNNGRDLRISLVPSQKLIDDAFVLIRRYGNVLEFAGDNETSSHRKIENCFYHSPVAAFDVCDENVKGIIRLNTTNLVIHPLPHRFGKSLHIITESDPPPFYSTLKNDAMFEPDMSNRDTPPTRARRFVTTSSSVITNEISNELFIETAIFVDRDLYRHMEKNYPKNTESSLIRFVLAMVNGVQLLYHHPSLGHKINFVLKRLEILYSDPKDLRRSSDIDIFLNNFCSWQKNLNPQSDDNSVHYDHAVILTGLDLYVVSKNGKISSQVVGLAPVAGMCTSTSSCTINEGKHFESVYVVAHEIGHNLGMRHDTSETNCDPSLYIMSPTLGSGKITWSSCSRDYLNTFLRSSQSKCLLDRGHFSAILDHSAEGMLPGERFDADQQCMLKYGKDSVKSLIQPLNDICRDLHCQRDRYTWTSHPALEGTECGEMMWCKSGVCSLRTTFLESFSIPRQIVSRSPAKANFIDDRKSSAMKLSEESFSKLSYWSDWNEPSECESGCLYGESGRLREGSTGLKFYVRSCGDYRHRKKCTGHDRKYESCIAKQCYSVPRTTVLEFANRICQRAKAFDDEIKGKGLQKNGETPQESCTVLCETKSGSTKSKSWTFPDGTACRNQDSDIDDNYYCVAGRCEKFLCANTSTNYFRMDPTFCPESQVLETENINPWQSTQENGQDYKSLELTGLLDDGLTNKTKNEVFIHPPDSFQRKHDAGFVNTEWRRHEKMELENMNSPSNEKDWMAKSTCHFSCMEEARGIEIVSSKVDALTNIRLCNPDNFPCPKLQTTFEFATNLCQKFQNKVRGLSGNGMQISPSVPDPDRSCRVACQDYYIYHRFYLVNGEQGHFPFGTKCSKTDNRYCVHGKCLEFGADNLPLIESHLSLALFRRFKRSLGGGGHEIKVRKKRNFLFYTPTNITEKIEQDLLQKLAAGIDLEIRGGNQSIQDDAIDLQNPIYISPEDYNSHHQYFSRSHLIDAVSPQYYYY